MIAEYRPQDVIYVLGPDPKPIASTYLARGQFDDFFYCRNLPFYAYYFRRLGAPQLAEVLRYLPLQPDESVRGLMGASADKMFVLGAHHARLSDSAIEQLRAAGYRVDDDALFSTHLYRVQRP
ncbi:MAG TPA: hypothetical protein VJR89_42455 [Polyangiales bacterium]|nr:hypothetical protein [Polyangiales bacterium]